MLSRRFHLPGLFAVLLALMAQLGAGATVPRFDPIALLTGAETLCHADGDQGGPPSQSPGHPTDCLVCPLCAALHAPATPLIAAGLSLTPPSLRTERRAELPPPSTAPPAPHRPPGQPRAPPITS
jgi:hypothetical protein